MKLAASVLVIGPERAARARVVADAAASAMKLGDADRDRFVEGTLSALEAIASPHEPVHLTFGLPGSGTPRAVTWLRLERADPTVTEASLLTLADEASVRPLPGGMLTVVLRWRVASLERPAAPAAVPGDAAEWTLQALGFAERTLLAERRARSGTEELLGIIAHALRNPIGSMASAADLLQLSPGDATTLEAATGILARSSRAALRLIADLEQLNQIDSGTLHLNVQELRPSHVADSAAEIARPLAQRRNIDLRVEKDASHRFVLGDPERLIQAIGNLVVASVEQSPEGEPVVLRTRAEDPYIVYEIEDRGPHVPPEALPSLFDRLRKSGPRRRSSGAFGLAAARELIEAHSGRLTCVSNAGGSTIMRVILPGA